MSPFRKFLLSTVAREPIRIVLFEQDVAKLEQARRQAKILAGLEYKAKP